MPAPERESRELQRVTAFTDAAVAIALTLLALPLVDIAQERSGAPLGTLWQEHAGDAQAFVLSFFVVAIFWRAHRRILEIPDRIDEGLLSLNTLWLLGVVFLPVPTAVLTFEDAAGSGPVVFYLATLCYVSVLATALSAWVATHPALRPPDTPTAVAHYVLPGATAAGTIAVITVLAVPLGSAALYALIAMPLVGRLARRLFRST